MKRGKYRKAVFVVTYSVEENEIYYLVLRRKLHWKGWEFPKGGVEKFEFLKNAVKREVFEETGLKTLRIKKHNFFGKYKYKKYHQDRPNYIGQSFSLFSVEVKKGEVNYDKREHSDYKWLKFDEAVKKVTFPNQKKALKIVNYWLEHEI